MRKIEGKWFLQRSRIGVRVSYYLCGKIYQIKRENLYKFSFFVCYHCNPMV